MRPLLKIRKPIGVLFAFMVCLFSVSAQLDDIQLAQHYFNMGEYEKALPYYEKSYKQTPIDEVFNRYYDCLTAVNDTKEIEKLLRRHASATNNPEHYILLGLFYEKNKENNKADKIYKAVVDQTMGSPSAFIHSYNAFRKYDKNDYSLQVITKGRNLMKGNYPFNFQFADYYGATGDSKKMIKEYLDLLDVNIGYKTSVQSYLSRLVDFSQTESDVYTLLKSELLSKAQSNPGDITATEMLTWFFIQSRAFNMALTQELTLDKRMNLNGIRVYELGEIAHENKDYVTAKKAFQYVIGLGENNRLFYQAENALLNTQFTEITLLRNVSQKDIQATVDQFDNTLNRLGKSNRTISLIMQLAYIEAYYNHNATRAVSLLNECLQLERLTDMQKAEVKIVLGDINVLQGDIWSASLYYMQVDKAFKNEAIGHEARFKNARIFYYDGEFNYAQSQLDVLKQGTSRLIANDAIELSILITDNFGLDSNFTAMYQFAQADLLIEQRKFDEAFVLFDSILLVFPYHSLGDEIVLKKAYAMELQGEWEKAIAYYDELLKYYSEDILADDALYKKGVILMDQLNDLEAAQECFKQLMLKYKGSLHVTDARKRFRQLRGDTNIED